MTAHPATLYGFVMGLVALIGVIVLIATGDVSADVGVPIISGIALGSVGVAGGVASPRPSNVNVVDTGTVTNANPDE
jgi:hypothetical protein